ncbi:hypothetical protein ACFT4A_32005 [Streptomyces sp. NPDC057099]|uniref:hypothetical protein n=1 Tax=Streptomyces sp. NPDC057099 TaxID=3346019 RepID=UPI00362FD21F
MAAPLIDYEPHLGIRDRPLPQATDAAFQRRAQARIELLGGEPGAGLGTEIRDRPPACSSRKLRQQDNRAS